MAIDSRLRALLRLCVVFMMAHAYGNASVRAESAIATPLRPQGHPGLGTLGGIAQTRDGFLWFGGREGLNRYDGTDVRAYPGPTGVPFATHGVHSILASKQGGLWVATGDGILGFGSKETAALYSDKRGKGALVFITPNGASITAETSPPSQVWVWSMKEDDLGNLWLATDRGLGLVKTQAAASMRRIEWVNCDQVTHDTLVADVLVTSTGLWLATDRGVFVRRGGRCHPTVVTEPVIALAEGHNSEIFVGTSRGLLEIVDGALRRQMLEGSGLPSLGVRKLLPDSDGSLWIGTGSGIVAIDSQWRITRSQLTPVVLNIFKDDEGSLWYLTSTRGAVQLKPAAVTTLEPSDGLGGTMAFAVLAARDGSVWVTTPQALTRFRAGRSDPYVYGKDVNIWSARAMAEALDGGVWFTADDEGLLLHKDGAFQYFPGARYPHVAHATTVAVGRDGALWIGAIDGRIARFPQGPQGQPSHVFSIDSGVCRGRTMAVAESPDGTMWWGTDAGLTRIQHGTPSCFSTINGLPSNDVSSLLSDSNGSLWLGTRSDVGLVNFSDGVARVLGPNKGFPVGGIFGIVEDDVRHLWWSSARGIHRASKQALLDTLAGRRQSLQVDSVGVQDGLSTEDMTSAFQPAAASTVDGHLLFPSLEGLAVIRKQSALRAPTGARPIIESVRLDGFEVEAADRLTTKRGRGDIELRYTSPAFLAPHRLRFEHLLEGFDARWVSAGRRRTAHYANLGPGRYRFRVRSVDNQGRPSNSEDAVLITVPARLDQMLTFRIFAGALLVLGLAAAYGMRVRMIHERSRLIHLERDRIARDLHDHLGQGLGAIGYLSDAIGFSEEALPVQVQDLLGKLRRVVSQTNHGINDLIWDLRHVSDRATLRSALSAVVERSRDMGMQVSLTMTPAQSNARKQHIREVPFVAQEAITNAAKHGGARNIAIAVVESGDTIEISIADDGTGMKAESAKRGGGFGITGMNERARRMNATLELRPNNALGHGVVVVLRIPI